MLLAGLALVTYAIVVGSSLGIFATSLLAWRLTTALPAFAILVVAVTTALYFAT